MEQRIAIKEILEDEWFKNGPQSPNSDEVSVSFSSVCSNSKTF